MKLSEKRILFTKLLGEFICEAFKRGYKIALDEVKAKNGHRENSLHYIGLAADFNLYSDQGQYLKDTSDHIELGHIWESLHVDTYWGGRFNDGNHYSLQHGGRM